MTFRQLTPWPWWNRPAIDAEFLEMWNMSEAQVGGFPVKFAQSIAWISEVGRALELKEALERLIADEYLPRNGDIELDDNGEPTGYVTHAGLWEDDVLVIIEAYRNRIKAEAASEPAVELFRSQAVTISRCGSDVTIQTDNVDDAEKLTTWLESLATTRRHTVLNVPETSEGE